MKRIYLDHNATTPIDPLVLEAMKVELAIGPANPSSIHYFGQEAKKRLTKARHALAAYFGIKPSELIFTSGGTEAINLILRGFFAAYPDAHGISSNLEHAAVLETLKSFPVTFLGGNASGAITPQQVVEAISPKTRLIALSAANSETGVKTDIEAIAKIAAARDIFFFVDGVALLGKEQFSIPAGISAMAFSGHKIHGPKGSGVAFIRSPHKIKPLLTGGGQEYGLRSGTENLAAIIGLTKAVELLKDKLPAATEHMRQLRNYFEEKVKEKFPKAHVNGTGPRLPNTSNIAFPGINGEELLMQLDIAGVAASHGSACSAGALEPSRVLINMGLSRKEAGSSVRFSISRDTTQAEIDHALKILSKIVS